MACKSWNDEWVAHIYGELEPAAERALSTHLETCAECVRTLDELRDSHALLQESAPEIPAAPRVVVLQPRRVWSGPWVFAAGAAFSLVLFGLGFMAGPRWVEVRQSGPEPAASEQAPAEATPASVEAELRDTVAALQARLERLEQGQQPDTSSLTAAEFRDELERLEHRFNQERAGDLEQIVRSLAASEQRTANWMEQTADAVTLLALRQDPRYSER